VAKKNAKHQAIVVRNNLQTLGLQALSMLSSELQTASELPTDWATRFAKIAAELRRDFNLGDLPLDAVTDEPDEAENRQEADDLFDSIDPVEVDA